MQDRSYNHMDTQNILPQEIKLKDEEIISMEMQEKLDNLFQELDKAIENKYYKLSGIICDLILKIDPNNLRVLDYINKIPDTIDEEANKDRLSFLQQFLILLTPSLFVLLFFYKFLYKNKELNEDYADQKESQIIEETETIKVEQKQQLNETMEEKKQKNSLKENSLNENKNKFKFSTINQFYLNQNDILNRNQFNQYKQNQFKCEPKYYNIQKCMSKIFKKII